MNLHIISLYLMLFVGSKISVARPTGYSSIQKNHDTATKKRAHSWDTNALSKEFKGIYWEDMFKDDNCTPEQRDKIIFATRYTIKLVQTPKSEDRYYESKAWDRYFGPYESWLSYGITLRNTASDIMNNIRLVQTYPQDGHATRTSESQKVRYTCKSNSLFENCGDKTRAKTISPGGSSSERWEIYFCPSFFTDPALMYLEERTNGRRSNRWELDDLETYERLIAHEWMHVKIFGFHDTIIDAEGILFKGTGQRSKIYRDTLCRLFAARDGHKANPATATNADSYAMFFSYYWFDKVWEWSGDTFTADDPESDAPAFVYIPSDDELPEPSFPVREEDIVTSNEFPQNCQIDESMTPPHIHCDPIGMEYDEWIQGLGSPFRSYGGCELSMECHKAVGYSVHAGCTCKCGDVPTPLVDERCDGFAGDPKLSTDTRLVNNNPS